MGPIVNAAKSIWPPVAFGFLLLFLFFLPLYEAPKNISSVLFVFLGGWIAFRRRHVHGSFSRMDPAAWMFLLLAISPFFAGIGSPYMESGERFSNALNWSLMPLVALVLVLFNASRNQLVWILRVLCTSSVISVMQAFYQLNGNYPQLNSLGHVNQSALYLAFCLVPAGLLGVNRQHFVDWLLVSAVVAAVFWFLGPSLSLVGFGASLIIVAGLFVIVCFQRKWFKTLGSSVCLGVVLAVVAMSTPPKFFGYYQGFKSEFDQRLASKTNRYSQRDRLVNSALAVAGGSVFGNGLGSFGEVASMKNIKAAVIERGGDWKIESRRYFSSSHGHNLFANVLVERGWVGVGSVSAFLLVFSVIFLRHIRQTESQVGLLTVLVICIAGLGQSVLHVEHGQLAFICLSLCSKLSAARLAA